LPWLFDVSALESGVWRNRGVCWPGGQKNKSRMDGAISDAI
jgi:hypothetical protein